VINIILKSAIGDLSVTKFVFDQVIFEGWSFSICKPSDAKQESPPKKSGVPEPNNKPSQLLCYLR
jgi:hypothetical protein